MYFENKMNIKENLFNSGLLYPRNLKRKHFSNYNKNANSEDEDGSDSTEDLDSVSSTSNSIISTASGVNLKRIGNKVLVTDENISDTLKELNSLQIEMELEDQSRSPISSMDSNEKLNFDFSSDDEIQDEEETGIFISDVLKNKLKELNNNECLYSQIKNENLNYNDLNNMQIIPWIPRNDFIQIRNHYEVEEPSDLPNNKQKRKLSQLNQLNIEDISSNENITDFYSNSNNHFSHTNSLSNFYLVEHEDDFKKFNNLIPNKCSDFKITELDNEPNDKISDEEEMDF